MAQQIINRFSQFELSNEEQLSGQILSINQLAVLQNLRSEYAHKKLSLIYTPNDHQTYVQQEAEITGWMSCLDYIIECHEVAITQTNQTIANSQELESGADTISIFEHNS